LVSANRRLLFGRSGLGFVSLGLPLVMFVALSLSAPDFLSRQNIANVNSQITALVIVALGQLIVALIGGIDLSVGSVVSLSSVLIVSLDPSLAVPVALSAGAMVGLANGFGVAVFGVHPLIMTLSTMTFVQGFSLLFMSGAGGVVPGAIIAFAKSNIGMFPAGFFWCLVAIAAASILLYRTRFGLRIFAIGANSQSAELSGVRVTAPRIACYVLCSVAGAIAGVYLTGRIASGDPTVGQPFGIDSVTAIALGGVQLSGGVGSVVGAVLGTITLGLISNGLNMIGVSPFFRAALTGVLLLGAVSVQRRKAIGI
jgi:ribose transport system permease protein